MPRSSCLLALALALGLAAHTAPASAAQGYVIRYDAIAAAGGFAGGATQALGLTLGEPVVGTARDATPSRKLVNAGFWHARPSGFLVGVEPAPGTLAFAFPPIAPNPSIGAATVRFTLPGTSASGVPTSLRVVDVAGRLVRTLNSATLPPGEHALRWDGTNSAGARAEAGVYFVELASGSFRGVRRLVLLR